MFAAARSGVCVKLRNTSSRRPDSRCSSGTCQSCLTIMALTPGNATALSLGSWTLASPAARDMEQFTNVLAERVSYQFGTNAAGSWFSLTKLVPWAKPDPFAIVRGGN